MKLLIAGNSQTPQPSRGRKRQGAPNEAEPTPPKQPHQNAQSDMMSQMLMTMANMTNMMSQMSQAMQALAKTQSNSSSTENSHNVCSSSGTATSNQPITPTDTSAVSHTPTTIGAIEGQSPHSGTTATMPQPASATAQPPYSQPNNTIAATATSATAPLGENFLSFSSGPFDQHPPHRMPDSDRGRPVLHAPPRLSQLVDEITKQKIIKDEYIDFRTLLDPYSPHEIPSNDRMQLEICNVKGQPQFYMVPPKSKPLSYEQWEDAWHIYSDVYGTAHPEEYPNLLQYHADVKRIANEGKDWEYYDVTYRKGRASNPLPWDTVRPGLDSAAKARWSPNPPASFVPPQATPPTPQPSSSQQWHSANPDQWSPSSKSTYTPQHRNRSFRSDRPKSNQPFRSQRSNATTKTPPPDIPKGYCFYFHLPDERCHLDRECTFKHNCPRCLTAYHPIFKCPKSRDQNPGDFGTDTKVSTPSSPFPFDSANPDTTQ